MKTHAMRWFAVSPSAKYVTARIPLVVWDDCGGIFHRTDVKEAGKCKASSGRFSFVHEWRAEVGWLRTCGHEIQEDLHAALDCEILISLGDLIQFVWSQYQL